MSAPCYASDPVANVKARIREIQRAKDSGRGINTALILHELQSADVAALSAARNQAWRDLLEDLWTWHTVRFVYNGIPIPWMSDEEFKAMPVAKFTGLDEMVPGGVILKEEGKPPRHITPPPGARLVQNGSKIDAVWPDGRIKTIASIVDTEGAKDLLAMNVEKAKRDSERGPPEA